MGSVYILCNQLLPNSGPPCIIKITIALTPPLPPKMIRDAFKIKKTSYRMTLSLLPFTPARPNLIVTSLKSDKVVFPGPPPSAPQKV